MNNRRIIMIFTVLLGCAIGLISVHIMNSGLEWVRDKTLVFSYVALFLSLSVGCFSLLKMRERNK